MKTAILGVWHVHAGDYTRKALEMGEVVGFYEKNDALANDFMKHFDLKRFNTKEELLESDAEGVIVCSATADHTEDIIAIANAKKHVFTEKVLCLKDEDCDKIENALNENGVSLTISYPQKYYGSRIAVKEVSDSGELGKINYLRFRNCHSGSVHDWLPVHFYNEKECGGGAMIDLGAHGMYLTNWILGMPLTASSAFTVSCERESVKLKNTDLVEDNAVTIMTFEGGAIAINETGFISSCSPVVFEVHGEDGFVRMEDNKVVKCTKSTGGKVVEVEIPDSMPSPIEQFLLSKPICGCSVKEAVALTKMMTMAYGK
jgi:predicted dehydrogenase